MAFPSVLSGYKTYLAAAGLTGLAIFQFSTGEVVPGIQSILAALSAVGLRSAISGIQS